jgi:2-polyprenyl-3-methyl-5-hydroxy-6-metoxy-1,4-benzoquinol methylase
MVAQDTEGLLSPFLSAQRIAAARPFLLGRVFDVGCGSGEITRYIGPKDYLGFDIDPESVSIARRRHPEYRFESRKPDQHERFDTVAALAVIEHVEEPIVFLSTLSDYLRDGTDSRIVLTTPHPRIYWIHAVGSRVGLFSLHVNREHKDLLDHEALVNIVKKAGLKLAIYRHFQFGFNQLLVLKRK